MARNRQRAKERQARRRAERVGGEAEWSTRGDLSEELARAEIEAGAPPSDTGRSDTLLASRPHEPPTATLDEEPEARARPTDTEAGGGTEPEDKRRRGRVAAFLAAVIAELRRVQWPDRAALTTMTGIVLGFVVIAGGYLGLLDFLFSRLVQAIL